MNKKKKEELEKINKVEILPVHVENRISAILLYIHILKLNIKEKYLYL
jgi:hypothetical protein